MFLKCNISNIFPDFSLFLTNLSRGRIMRDLERDSLSQSQQSICQKDQEHFRRSKPQKKYHHIIA